MSTQLTILTDPVPSGKYFLIENARRFLRLIKHKFKKGSCKNKVFYRGHFAVTRSVIEGLRKIGASFNYNPSNISSLADTVHVLSSVQALRQMILLKRKGQIKKLYAGPNIVLFSTQAKSILASPEIDGVINHCDFACKFWAADHPELLGKCFRWPAGVNTDYWIPDNRKQKNHILIFDKRIDGQDPGRVQPYYDYLKGHGWTVEVLVRCGNVSYTQDRYLELLQQSCLMIGFTVGSESQGIAWAEAWSCNVPTLILKNTTNVYKGREFSCSTAPYLSLSTGSFFDGFDDFKDRFKDWILGQNNFSPRDWVLRSMSDEVSARMLYSHLIGKVADDVKCSG